MASVNGACIDTREGCDNEDYNTTETLQSALN